ncbi:ABC transporter ATP-binding protein [Sphingomicrobium sp. XHP0235]|uniref:ABC transporter ATP-binding protein n=1 Tax=Sphingomicrobium aquimarinum TaxID=3133971 RepID=UPI0031FE6DF9
MSAGAGALIADLRARFGARLAIYVAVQFVTALVEGVGILLLLPLLAALSGEGPDWLPPLPATHVVLGLFLLVMIVRAMLMLLRGRMQAGFYRDYSVALSSDVAAALATMGWPAASDIGQSRMQQYWTSDVPRSAIAVSQLLSIAVFALLLGVQGVIALALSPTMAGAAFILLLLATIASWSWVRRSHRQGVELVDAIGDARESGFVFHAGLKSALAEGRETRFLDRFRRLIRAENDGYYAIDAADADAGVANQLAGAVGLAAILYIGIELVALDTSVLLLLLLLFARMMGPARALVSQYQRFLAFAPSFAPVAELLALARPERADTTGDEAASWNVIEGRRLHVGPASQPLGPFEVRLERGGWLGLSGPSGAGKSLLVDTIAGLIPPARGDLYLDGAPFDPAARPGWREGLAYLGQDGSLLGNRPRSMLDLPADPDQERLEHLFAAFGLVDLMARLGSLDAPIGDRATQISGGERQRFALVRAVMRSPKLLILDEATAALDLAAEEHVLAALKAELPDTAVILVSHRPQSLAHCDRVISF